MADHAKLTGSTPAKPRESASGLSRLGPPLLAGAAIALAIVAYVQLIHPNIFPRNFGVVEEGSIYRAGRLTPGAVHRLVEQHGIKTIVDLGAYDKDLTGERIAERTAKSLGIERRVFRLEGDGRGNPNAYVEALRIIADPAKQPVLVQCSAGSQRTSTCIILYRTIVQGKSREEVMTDAYLHGHDPKDNPHLAPYLDEWAPKIEAAYKAGQGVLIEGRDKAEIVSPAKE